MSSKDLLKGRTPTRWSTSIRHRNLAVGEISDSQELDPCAKAIEIENNSSGTIKVVVKSIEAVDGGLDEITTITVPAGTVRLFLGAVAQIMPASTGLATAITAGTAAVILHLL